MIQRPEAGEVGGHYAAYVERVGDGDVAEVLARQAEEMRELVGGLPPARLRHRYAEGKWSVAEVVGHVIDCERIMATRLLVFARGDGTPLPGFDQDEYVRRGNFDARPAEDLLREHAAVRAATLAMLPALAADPERQRWTGTANGTTFTVRTMPYLLAGHERHHLDVLRERYL